MSIDRPITAVPKIMPRDPDLKSGLSNGPVDPVTASVPLDWNVAVRAAGIFLDERFGPPGSRGDPAMFNMAQDLAARLCAYDEIIEVVEAMNPRQPDPAARE